MVALAAIGASTANLDECDIFEERSFPDGDPHVMVGAATAGKSRGVTPKHLSKIWRISHEDAAWTIEATTQLIHRDPGTTLSWNDGTDDRALWYKHITSILSSDTMYATNETKLARSTRGNTCAQIFVLDKMFCAVYPMLSQNEYLSAPKQFAKDVGVPSALICDSHPSQLSQNEYLSAPKQFAKDVGVPSALICDSHPSQKARDRDVKKFLTSIGTMLKVLKAEVETQHAN